MSTLRLTTSISGGVSVGGAIDRECDQQVSLDPVLTAGKPGELTTRSTDTTGTLTLETGHGITTAQVVDLYWAGGMRYGVIVGTVSSNSVPISAGAGDVLPSASTEVVVGPRVNAADLGMDGDNIQVIVIGATKRIAIDFLDDGGLVLLHVEVAAGESYQWFAGCGFTNPLAGEAVVDAKASCGDAALGTTLKGLIGYDA
jgi:hypothetical protein